MNKELFLEKFAEQFEETDAGIIKLDSVFKDLDEWSSLLALSVIAMSDEEFDVTLKGDDIRNAETVLDLFKIAESRYQG